MKAILVATGADSTEIMAGVPGELVHFFDRPFIQHVIEYLVQLGVDDIEIVLNERPDRFESLIGNGDRWGIRIRHCLSKTSACPISTIRTHTEVNPNEAVLIGCAHTLPQLTNADMRSSADAMFFMDSNIEDDDTGEHTDTVQAALTVADASTTQWTGWAWLRFDRLTRLPNDVPYLDVFEHLNRESPGDVATTTVNSCLNVASAQAMLASVDKVLRKDFTGLLLSGTEVEPGVWLSRNVAMQPSVVVRPPVYIGENCRIDRMTTVGPTVVVSANCILATECSVEKSVIFPDSYVGEQLELSDVLVERNRLINVRMGTAVTVTDDFILSSLSGNRGTEFATRVVRRVVGTLFFVVLSPLFLLTWAVLKMANGGKPALNRYRALRIPVVDDPLVWTTFDHWTFGQTIPVHERRRGRRGLLRFFFLEFLPGLLGIVGGALSFVGVEPRTPKQVRALETDWRELYLASKPGLITELDAMDCPNPSRDDLYSSEAFYAVNSGVWYDVKVIWRAILRWMTP